jgi:hypothetical protein
MDAQHLLIEMGLLILVIGITWPFLSRIGSGGFPTTSLFNAMAPRSISLSSPGLFISVVLNALFWQFNG